MCWLSLDDLLLVCYGVLLWLLICGLYRPLEMFFMQKKKDGQGVGP